VGFGLCFQQKGIAGVGWARKARPIAGIAVIADIARDRKSEQIDAIWGLF